MLAIHVISLSSEFNNVLVHLHGHTFQVLYRSPPNSTYNRNQPYKIPANPVRRDVIFVNPKGFVIIAFRADNPGVWFL
jgi:FtsP/CotA-like multicopper oxidase with cupredoxin domain